MFTTAPANIMSRVPVRNLSDIKGLALGAPGGASQLLNAWGANQIDIFMSETPETLQNSVLQGLFSSLEVMKDLTYAEYFHYVTKTDAIIYPFAVVMNMDTWNSLPVNVQKVIEDLGTEQSEWTGRYLDYRVKSSIEWSQKTYQVEFVQFSQEKKAKWDVKLSTITEKWIKEATSKGYPAEAILEDIKALIRKHSLNCAWLKRKAQRASHRKKANAMRFALCTIPFVFGYRPEKKNVKIKISLDLVK